MTEIEYRRGAHLFGGYGSERYRWHLYIGSLCIGEMVGTIEDMDKRLAEIRAEIGTSPDPTPAMLDDAAREIEATLAGDAQHLLDLDAVWRYCNKTQMLVAALEQNHVHIYDAFMTNSPALFNGTLAEVGEWRRLQLSERQRQQEAQDAKRE